ncbi:MAG TPA: cyanophycin synthetase, partial [Gammaproteobacteria bacterium]|nr:cyanophycin synthetase [Gammaproteobacteria bacterium]
RSICKGKLWCVFGCGGDRDLLKRKVMGKIATDFADQIIITNDNPRTEEPKAIIRDILQDLTPKELAKTLVEEDRANAIAYAIQQALKDDVVLIAGKGHEDFQIIGNKKIPFSDIQTVKKIVGESL